VKCQFSKAGDKAHITLSVLAGGRDPFTLSAVVLCNIANTVSFRGELTLSKAARTSAKSLLASANRLANVAFSSS
jgi:hypothetical protein